MKTYLQVKEDFELETNKGFTPLVKGELITPSEYIKRYKKYVTKQCLSRRFRWLQCSPNHTYKTTLANIRFMRENVSHTKMDIK